MPIVLGLVAFGFHLSTTLDDRWGGVMGILLAGAGIALGLALFGLLARTTAGVVAFWFMGAAVVASVIYFTRGEVGEGLAMLGEGVMFYAVQFFLVGLRVRAGELPGPSGGGSAARPWPAHRLVARCFYGVLMETMSEQGGTGALLLLPGDELLFINFADTRTHLLASHVESWEEVTGSPVLQHLDGLDPTAETLALHGSAAVMKPVLYIQADDLGAWRSWLQSARVPARG